MKKNYHITLNYTYNFTKEKMTIGLLLIKNKVIEILIIRKFLK